MTAALIGATGLVGNHLLNELLNDDFFKTVRILIRRPLNVSHPKLEKKIVDFNDSDSVLVALENSHVVFCSIGTTRKKVKGDLEAYRKIDFDIPVNLARFCKLTGCGKFILVSTLGANSKSRNFYLKLKGEVEDAVAAMDLPSVHFMRPSMLLGERDETRMGETIGKTLMNSLSFIIPARYKPVHAKNVAKAMLAAGKSDARGVIIHENQSLLHYN